MHMLRLLEIKCKVKTKSTYTLYCQGDMIDRSMTRTSVCMAGNAADFLYYSCCFIGVPSMLGVPSMRRGSCILGNKAIAKVKAAGSG